MSWYRTYRPQTVASLHSTPVREAFTRILQSGSFAHAYLLTGPKGTGKTSGARILAKVLNCEKNRMVISHQSTENNELSEPCNVCPTCLAITNGSALCVTEMDAASNRGIDDIRSLIERVGLSPGDGMVSVTIIDEVHMLTTEAFNALLKVLEEPPAHVVFILATTELHKVPATIVSRCTQIAYRKAQTDEIATALATIAKTQGITVNQRVLERIGTLAEGSFRDGVKLFEQVAAGKQQIDIEDIEATLQSSSSVVVESLMQALGKKDAQAVSSIFEQVNQEGKDVLQLQKDIIQALHGRLFNGIQTKSPHMGTYIKLLKLLNVPASHGLYPALSFELACLEWCVPISVHAIPEATTIEIPQAKKIEAQAAKEEVVTEESESAPIQIDQVLEQWPRILFSIRQKNASVEALLRSTKPLSLHKRTLVLEASYQFHKEQLELDRNRRVIEEVLTNRLMSKLIIHIQLAQKATEVAKTEDANISGAVDESMVRAAEEAFL